MRADEAEARALGVTGVPFFVVDRRVAVSGAQPAEVFTQLLEAGWREANPLQTLASADPDAAGVRRRLVRDLTLRPVADCRPAPRWPPSTTPPRPPSTRSASTG